MTVSDWGPDSPAQDPVPGDTVAQGATNPPNPDPSAISSGNDGSGDLRAELAGLVRRPHDGPVSEPTMAYALAVADAVLAAGYRLVSEDEATVDRVAAALIEVEREVLHPLGMILTDAEVRPLARAAVRALREGPSPTSKAAQSRALREAGQ